MSEKSKVIETSGLVKVLGSFLVASAIIVSSSASYKNISNLLNRPVQEELILQEAAKETIPPRINGEELQRKIEENNLNTGKYSPEQVVEMIEKSIQKAGGLPNYMDEGIVYSFINPESLWNPNAKSRRGAKGLGQITKATWKDHNPTVSYDRVYNPAVNLETTIKVINGNEQYFEKKHPNWEDLSKEEKLVIHAAAYNWGKGNLRRIRWNLEKDNEKIPKETKRHIKKVLGTYEALFS